RGRDSCVLSHSRGSANLQPSTQTGSADDLFERRVALGGIGRRHARAGESVRILEHSCEERQNFIRSRPMTEPARPAQVSDMTREARLLSIRREAEKKGRAVGEGIRPEGAPFPKASPETGYYGIHLLKEPQWTWEIPVYFFAGGAAGAAALIGGLAKLTGK